MKAFFKISETLQTLILLKHNSIRNQEIKTDVYFLYFTESTFQTYNFYKNKNNDYLIAIDGHQHHQKSI
ncbi:hypothetical protein pb186bvf_005465 [Paramecium bursaria]